LTNQIIKDQEAYLKITTNSDVKYENDKESHFI